MAENTPPTFMVEDARIIFRNFSGEEGMYNSEGERNFCVILDNDLAKQMDKDGWNIKYLNPRDDDEVEEPTPYVQVKVSYKNRPPKIVLITSTGRQNIGEDLVGTLDWVDILTVDLICRGFVWEVNGKTGVKAYLQSMFMTIDEDPLERKYAQMEQDGE